LKQKIEKTGLRRIQWKRKRQSGRPGEPGNPKDIFGEDCQRYLLMGKDNRSIGRRTATKASRRPLSELPLQHLILQSCGDAQGPHC
jgi:hypothetical protein